MFGARINTAPNTAGSRARAGSQKGISSLLPHDSDPDRKVNHRAVSAGELATEMKGIGYRV